MKNDAFSYMLIILALWRFYTKWVTSLTKGLRRMIVLTCAGMLFVLLGGALVTKTGAGRGCGDDWPLCNGKFIPAYTIESMIEYSHRAVSGTVGLLVLITAVWVWRSVRRQRKEALLYAFGALFFTTVQAFLGAAAVKWEQSSAVLALHFGISLLAFACTLLLVFLARGRGWESGKEGARLSSGGLSDRHNLEATESSPSSVHRIKWLVWGTTLYTYVVVYLGAFVRHTESQGGCVGWPLCNGEVIPELTGATGIAFLHRVAAFVLLLVYIVMAATLIRSFGRVPQVRKPTLAALILIFLQVLTGGSVVLTIGYDSFLYASLLHTAIIAGLFGVMCHLSIVAWKMDSLRTQPHVLPAEGEST